VRRLGDQRVRRVDVRVVAATAKDLAAEVAGGRFRDDLFYRLNVVTLHLPPLAERTSDIAPLARHIAAQLARRLGRPVSVSAAAVEWLERQPWPGNVRELQHAIERAAVLTDKAVLEPDDLLGTRAGRPDSRTAGQEGVSSDVTLKAAVDAAEREAISAALAAVGGNRREAARRLGVSLRTLFYKMERHNLE